MNRKREILKFLDILSKLNPNVQFYYDTRKREIIADNTSFFVPNEVKNISDIKLPQNSGYTFNEKMNDDGIRIAINSEMVADLRISNILSKENSEARENYTAYTPSKLREVFGSISDSVSGAIDSITRTNKPKRTESAFGQLVREAREQDQKETVDNSIGEPLVDQGFLYTSEKETTKNDNNLSDLFDVVEKSTKKGDKFSNEQYVKALEQIMKSNNGSISNGHGALESTTVPFIFNLNNGEKPKDSNKPVITSVAENKYIKDLMESHNPTKDINAGKNGETNKFQYPPLRNSNNSSNGKRIPESDYSLIEEYIKNNRQNQLSYWSKPMTVDLSKSFPSLKTKSVGVKTPRMEVQYIYKDKDLPIIKKAVVKKSLKTKLSDKFSNFKQSVLYFFDISKTVDEKEKPVKEKTVIGKGPKKIVKKPLKARISDKIDNAMNAIVYFFDESKKVAKEVTTIGKGPKKIVKRPLRVKLSDKFSNFKNAVKYFFDKSKKVKKDNLNGVKPVQPPKPEPITPVIPPKDKRYDLIEKDYILKCKEAYANLGEYEKMFVDDAKAECLNPKDEEFRMMLSERCVNKDQIMNYYEALNKYKLELAKNKIIVASKINEEELLYLYVSLDDYERMFVNDAIAENISFGDFEYSQMLSERCVNKNGVNKFMKAYKEYLVKQKELVSDYTKLSTQRDLNVLKIEDLKKITEQYEKHLSEADLAKLNKSDIKKEEIINIINRFEDSKSKELIKKGVCK